MVLTCGFDRAGRLVSRSARDACVTVGRVSLIPTGRRMAGSQRRPISVTYQLSKARLIVLAALPMLALTVAGCSGGSSSGRQVANLPGGSAQRAGGTRLT